VKKMPVCDSKIIRQFHAENTENSGVIEM